MVEAGADPENLCKKNGMKSGDQAVVLIHGLESGTVKQHQCRAIPEDLVTFAFPVPSDIPLGAIYLP